MGFKNSPPYIPKKNRRCFARPQFFHVNDIMVFSHILEEHIPYFHSVFQLFDSYGIKYPFNFFKLPVCRFFKT